MHFKKLLTMFTITFFASSGTMLLINTNVSNNKLIKNCLVNNHETFSKLEGTSGLIQSITSDQKGNVYAANNEGIIYYISENNKDIKPIFKSEGIIQAIAGASL